MNRKKIVVLGSRGMLGQELVKCGIENCRVQLFDFDRDSLDVTDFIKLKKVLQKISPDVVFNAVAYNAVDACESDNEEHRKLIKLNVEVPTELANLSKNLGFTFVQYSSDYVFSGEELTDKTKKYYTFKESDRVNPLSKYALSRVEAENNIKNILDGKRFYIIRLSKLFGVPAVSKNAKKSFFEFMLEKGLQAQKSGETLKAVDEEFSKFTYARDLAKESLAIVEDNCDSGIYHIANEGVCSWYEGVKMLYDIANIKVDVLPVKSDEFPRPAKRPYFSPLENTKRKKLRHYSEALEDFLMDMNVL